MPKAQGRGIRRSRLKTGALDLAQPLRDAKARTRRHTHVLRRLGQYNQGYGAVNAKPQSREDLQALACMVVAVLAMIDKHLDRLFEECEKDLGNV